VHALEAGCGQRVLGRSGGIRTGCALGVILEDHHVRAELIEAWVGQDRPFRTLDVDLHEVGVEQVGEGVDDRHLDPFAFV
jgi:hypothetical protein